MKLPLFVIIQYNTRMRNLIVAPAIKEYCLNTTTNWNLWGNSVGARDFSPDWNHRYFGTEVPCPDNDKHQFVRHHQCG